eukprot:gene19141-22542_t
MAMPEYDWAPVYLISVSTSSAFTISFNDGYRTLTTGSVNASTSADYVQRQLQDLSSVRSVLVNRIDQSLSTTFDVTSSTATLVWFKITLLDAGFGSSMGTISVPGSVSGVSVSTVNAGYAASSGQILTRVVVPTSPENVVATVVSNSELGIRWDASSQTGGDSVDKYLIEWDYDPYFSKSYQPAYSQVITASDAASFNAKANYSYQITGLSKLPTYVRVSAFNSAGYSKPAHAYPLGSQGCDTMPFHCSILPVDQLLFKPISPNVTLSEQEVANRLQISWQQPTNDQYGFVTTTVAPHTPPEATTYRVEYATQSDFSDAKNIDLYMISGDNVDVDCQIRCSYTIGNEVQNI